MPQYHPALPHIGRLLRKLRLERGLSRERLAFPAGVSASYIAQLEAGNRSRPTAAVMTALLRELEQAGSLGDAQRRQLDDLSGGHVRADPTLPELRAEVTAQTAGLLDDFDAVPACCLDAGWNVLAYNDSYAEAFPGVVADGNMLRCFYADPRSKQLLVEWREETELAVRLLRGRIARQADSAWYADLLAELSRFREFRQVWEEGEVRYQRDRGPMELRHPVTGARYAAQPHSFRLAAGDHHDRVRIQLHLPVG